MSSVDVTPCGLVNIYQLFRGAHILDVCNHLTIDKAYHTRRLRFATVVSSNVNRLKPTSYVMHHQFNIQ